MGDKQTDKTGGDSPSVADYIKMSDTEKNDAVQRAVIKLKMRVHEILSLLETGMKSDTIVHKKVEKKD